MGERDEFDEFFLANHGALVRSMTVITGDAALADDVVQDAFQRAFVRWRRVRRYDEPIAWVRRVAINRSRDVIRSEQRRRGREERVATPEGVHDDVPDVDLPVLLDGLSLQQRTAMTLHYLDGLSVAQTADAMQLSEGAVKYHLHEGRKNVAGQLEKGDADG
ncbi:MAG: sigma-70 family RNA polymerase sigma factor [Actinomycetota bacterium]